MVELCDIVNWNKDSASSQTASNLQLR